VTYQSPRDFVTEDLMAMASQEWTQQILPFVPDAPPAEELLPQVRSFIESLWD
jgi:hypothetical protein